MALVFSIIKEEITILKTVEILFKNAIDPPVFYSAGMLEVFKITTQKSFCMAVLLRENLPIIALPILKIATWQNVDFPGWDNLDIVKSNDASEKEIENFWVQLLKQTKVLKLNAISEKSSALNFAKQHKHRLTNRRKCPYVPLFENWELQNEAISKKLVRNIRQYGNKAEREGITFKIYEANQLTKAEKLAKLETAFAFHNVRMSHINQDSKFTPEAFSSYHQNVLTIAENVFIIEARNKEGETVACFYGLQNKNRLAYFNGGYNQDYALYSIGTLLVAELISYAMQRSVKVFDFLRGNEAYKQKWTEVYDLNKDVYLSDNTKINKARATYLFFQDTRKRIGTKNALKTAFGGV